MNQIKLTLRAIQAKFRSTFMFGLIVPEYKGIHWCWSYSELLAWADQYPYSADIIASFPTGFGGQNARVEFSAGYPALNY